MDFSTRKLSHSTTVDILDIMPGNVGNPIAKAILLSPESPEFAKADDEFNKQLAVLQQNKKTDKSAIQKLGTKRLAACIVELIDCYIGDKKYSTDKADIEEFLTEFPFVFDQLETKLVSRSSFLQNAEEPTSAT